MTMLQAQKIILALLIVHTPFSQGFDLQKIFNHPAGIIGTCFGASLITAVTTGWICTRNSVKQGEEAKAQLQLERENARHNQQAIGQLSRRNKELEQVLSQEQKDQEQHKKINKQRIQLETAERFAKTFKELYDAYHTQNPEALAQDSSFQTKLEAIVRGTNPHPQFREEFDNQVSTLERNIIKIDPAELTEKDASRRESILTILPWTRTQANNSHIIYTTQQEMMRKQLELEHTTHLARIAAEREAQAKIETESTKKVCAAQEEAAQRLNLTTIEAQQLVGRVGRTLDDGLYKINQTIRERLDTLNAWQANRAQEHAETRAQFDVLQREYGQLLSSLERFKELCAALTHTTDNSNAKLESIEKTETSLKSLVQELLRKINTEFSAIEGRFKKLEASLCKQPQPQVSASQSEYDKNLFDAYKPAQSARPEDEE